MVDDKPFDFVNIGGFMWIIIMIFVFENILMISVQLSPR